MGMMVQFITETRAILVTGGGGGGGWMTVMITHKAEFA